MALRPVRKRKDTLVCLKKDGEIWRKMMTSEEINDWCYPYEALSLLMLDDLVQDNGVEVQAHGDLQ